jgi:hypothetical protein
MSQTQTEVKQVQVEFKIKGYYLRLVRLDSTGAVRESEPYSFLRNKLGTIQSGPINEPGEWVSGWDYSNEEIASSAYLFSDPDLAGVEIKRLAELPMMVDTDNADPDDTTGWLFPHPEMQAVLDKDYMHEPVHVRFEIMPVLEVTPMPVANYSWTMEKAPDNDTPQAE